MILIHVFYWLQFMECLFSLCKVSDIVLSNRDKILLNNLFLLIHSFLSSPFPHQAIHSLRHNNFQNSPLQKYQQQPQSLTCIFLSILNENQHSVHPPWGGGGELNLLPNFQNEGEGLTGTRFLERDCWEREGDFFQGWGCNFLTKNKLKSGMFNDKKKLQTRKLCSVITKNSKF